MKTTYANRFQGLFTLICFLSAFLSFSSMFAQGLPAGVKEKQPPLHEFYGDDYVQDSRDSHAKTPAYRYSGTGFSIVQVNVDIDGYNIVGDAANEPSITFDRNDPDRLAIGWRQFDNINNNFRQAGIGFSNDGGQTWIFPEVIDPGVFRSDPVLRSDAEGNFFYNSLTLENGTDYICNVFKSEDGGETWDEGVYAQGGDKQWMAIDQTDGIGSGNMYAYWTSNYSICWPNAFSRSVDGNQSWDDCSSIPSDPYWGTTMVAPNGDLYIGGSQWNGFVVTKSSTAQVPGLDVQWDFDSYVFLDGNIVGFGGTQCPNPDGLLGQTIITMDSSGGPGDGNIYLLCSVDRSSTNDPCDVMFARSLDGGLTWELPVRVNDDPGNNAYQWFGTMSVAPDGRIDVIWLDTRDYPGLVYSALYYSYSLDQGETWTQNVRLSESFDPHVGWPQQNKMGDYFDMFSDDEGAHLAWAATFNGEQDVYYSVIVPDYVGMKENEKISARKISTIYPNPFSTHANISFTLDEKCEVTLKVFTMRGDEVATLINESLEQGSYREYFDGTGLNSGVYYYRLQAGSHQETGRMVLVR